jgi:hypothetical protein
MLALDILSLLCVLLLGALGLMTLVRGIRGIRNSDDLETKVDYLGEMVFGSMFTMFGLVTLIYFICEVI